MKKRHLSLVGYLLIIFVFIFTGLFLIYKGSSEFDSKEMSIFIDGIIEHCEEQGIPTLTKDEIERLRLR